MRAALTVEWWKVRRSPVVLVATTLQVVFVPLLALGMVLAAGRPDGGVLSAKADLLLSGEGWDGYLGAVTQVAAAAVFVGAGVVVAWVFGREHVDGTFPALSAAAVPRGTIASAKFVVLLGWSVVLAVALTASAAMLGAVADVGAFEWAGHVPLLLRLLAVAGSTAVLALPVGFVASVGRGYLAAIGVVVMVLATTQVLVVLGAGGWFPFALPGMAAVAGPDGVAAPGSLGIGLAVLVVVGGIVATVTWWRRADVR